MARKLTLGTRVDNLFKLRENIREKTKELDVLKQQKAILEESIMQTLDDQDNSIAKGSLASVSITSTVVPSVEDWDSFYKFIRRNNAFYLLQRRANSAPYRELLDQRKGKKLPGVSSVTQRTLNLRKKSS